MIDHGLRPILKDVLQDTLDIAKVFKLLQDTDVGKLKAIDVYFTEQGIGYLNALASLNPNLFVVSEDKYLKVKSDNADLILLNKKLISDNLEFKEISSKIENKNNIDLLLIDVYKKDIKKVIEINTKNKLLIDEQQKIINKSQKIIKKLRLPLWSRFLK